MYNQNKPCYKSLEYNENTNSNKVWYIQSKGYIIKSWVDPHTNLIVEKRIPYNQPNNFLNYLDNYFKNDLK
jgi:hypothetical protein